MRLTLWIITIIAVSALIFKLYSGNAEVERDQYRATSDLAECSGPLSPQAADGTSIDLADADYEGNITYSENSVEAIWIILPNEKSAIHSAGTGINHMYRWTPEEASRRTLHILMAHGRKIVSEEFIAASTP